MGNVKPFAISLCQYVFTYDQETYLEKISFIKKYWSETRSLHDVINLLRWNIPDLIDDVFVAHLRYLGNVSEIWEMNFDWKHGMCYTFDPKRHGFATMPIKDFYNRLSSIFISVNVRLSVFVEYLKKTMVYCELTDFSRK